MLALIVAVLLVAQDKPEDPAKKIKELQKERIVVLEKLVDHATTRFRSAQGSYEEVLETQIMLLKAQLDAAEKESDRIELYTRSIEVLKQFEKVAQSQREAGRGTEAAVLKIKARRLEVEIQLEQSKLKEAEGKKEPKK